MSSSLLAANAKGGDASVEIAPPSQDTKKCRYCNYEHLDILDLRFHEEMHKGHCEEKEVMRHEGGEYGPLSEDSDSSSPFDDTARTFFELGSAQRIALIFKIA